MLSLDRVLTINGVCSSIGPGHSGFEAACIHNAGDCKGVDLQQPEPVLGP